jgi:hypothetical protein
MLVQLIYGVGVYTGMPVCSYTRSFVCVAHVYVIIRCALIVHTPVLLSVATMNTLIHASTS